MPTPHEIIEGLEAVLDVFTSNIRHRERVAFILCDNLVELACRTKAHQHNHQFNQGGGFRGAWNAPGVQLIPNGLGARVQGRHDIRNTMQHGSAAVTVTVGHCADAIIDVCRVVDKLWRNSTKRMLRAQYRCALRVVVLYSSNGDTTTQQAFEEAMRQCQWRGMADERKPRVVEVIVEPGLRQNWYYAIHQSPALVDQVLDSVLQDGA